MEVTQASDGTLKGPYSGIVRVWLLGSFALPVTLMQGPGLALIPNLYAQRYHLDLALVGMVLLPVRLIFDSLLTPAIGYWSDRTRSKWGRRKPWLLLGSILAALGITQLYRPGEGADLLWLAVWMSVIYAASTTIEVTHTAWGAEISQDYDERARIFIIREGFINAGALLLAVLPSVYSPTNEMDFVVLDAVAWWSVALLTMFTALCLWFVPDGTPSRAVSGKSWRALLEMLSSRPSAIFLAYTCLLNCAAGSAGGMFFLYMTTYLGLGPHFTLITVSSMAVATLSLPAWEQLFRRTSKKGVLIVSTSLLIPQLLMGYLIVPGTTALPLYIVMEAGWYTLFGATFMASRAMLGDLVDYMHMVSGQQRSGEYVAIWSLTCKAAQAAGAAMGYVLASAYSFRADATTLDGEAIVGLLLAYSGLPAALVALAALLSTQFPLDRRRMQTIGRALQRRARKRKGGDV